MNTTIDRIYSNNLQVTTKYYTGIDEARTREQFNQNSQFLMNQLYSYSKDYKELSK